LLALDARTGKRLWHFQTVHHDLWDYDLCSAPQLITVQHGGKKIEAVAVAGKVGFLYVFERLTGKPLWPIEERPVPVSGVPEELASRTQPIPTVLPPFSRQVVTTNDINPFYSPQKREETVKRIAAARTGLFEPLSAEHEVFAMPGAVGGANRGNTAADPDRGIVYIMTQDFASVYQRLKTEPPLASGTVQRPADTNVSVPKLVSETQSTRAQKNYELLCVGCHGPDLAGKPNVPSLVGVGKRLSFDDFSALIGVGKGVMPGFPHVERRVLEGLYAYVGGSATEATARPDAQRERNESRGYPAGVKGPVHNFSSGYGMEFPDLLGPPWSWIVAYDLNKGVIKWRRPLGHDPKIPKTNGKDLGMPVGSQRKGMVVTATGLLISTCLDGNIYAYDTENGDKLWSTPLPRNTEGIPAMYEVDGRQYFVVCAMGKVLDATLAAKIPSGYIVYALPERIHQNQSNAN
jgi:quinoprotein glucose dehydrogenase